MTLRLISLALLSLVLLLQCQKAAPTTFCSVGSAELSVFLDHLSRLYVENDGKPLQHEGRGNGVGHLALAKGTCFLAPLSRRMTDPEIDRIVRSTGAAPVAIPVGLDALVLVTRQDHPATTIKPDEVFTIYHKGPGGSAYDRAYRVNTASERYQFFKAIAVKDQSISDQILELPDPVRALEAVEREGGLAFARMAELKPGLKALTIELDFEKSVQLTPESVASGLYPYSRHLYFYLPGNLGNHPERESILAFVQLALSPEGQALLGPLGLYALPLNARRQSLERLRILAHPEPER